jgi:lipoyl-dependent peroxiredoxin subunit D
MDLQIIKESLPDYAKDIKLNLANLLTTEDQYGLTTKQVAGILLAAAYACKQSQLIIATENHAREFLDEIHINSIKAATTIMAMNNIYYRFLHLVQDNNFNQMPAKLRMNILANPGISKIDFELYSLAISAINGCGMCMDAHVKSLLNHCSKESIQHVIRIAAIMHAVSQTLIISN